MVEMPAPPTATHLCAKHGAVTPIAGFVKGASAGKITAGILTGGISLLATGVRSKKGTVLVCPRCSKPVVEIPRR